MGFNPFSAHDWKHKVGKPIEGVFKDGAHEVEGAASSVKDAIPEIAEEVIKVLEKELKALLHSSITDKVFNVIQGGLPVKTKQKLLIFEFEANIRSKVPILKKALNHPPKNGHDIVKMLQQLTDDDIVIVHPTWIVKFIPGAPYIGIDPAVPYKLSNLEHDGKEIFKLLEKIEKVF